MTVILLKDWKSLIQPEEVVEVILATKALFEKFTSYVYLICAYLMLFSTNLAQKEQKKEARDSCSRMQHGIPHLSTKSLDTMLNLPSQWWNSQTIKWLIGSTVWKLHLLMCILAIVFQ